MKINGLRHFNIRCSGSDLAVLESFYAQVIGLRRGYRPDFKNQGIWLYDGDQPLVPVSARCPDGFVAGENHNGSVDHMRSVLSIRPVSSSTWTSWASSISSRMSPRPATRSSSAVRSAPCWNSTSQSSNWIVPFELSDGEDAARTTAEWIGLVSTDGLR